MPPSKHERCRRASVQSTFLKRALWKPWRTNRHTQRTGICRAASTLAAATAVGRSPTYYDVIRGGRGEPATAAAEAPRPAVPGGGPRQPSGPTSASRSPCDAGQAAGAVGCCGIARTFPRSRRFLLPGQRVAKAAAGMAWRWPTRALALLPPPGRLAAAALPCSVRWLATASDAAGAKAAAQKYAATLALPQTAFPMRRQGGEVERQYLEARTTAIWPRHRAPVRRSAPAREGRARSAAHRGADRSGWALPRSRGRCRTLCCTTARRTPTGRCMPVRTLRAIPCMPM